MAHDIPSVLRGRPFTTAEAAAHGVTAKMLRGSRYIAVHPGHGVWAVADEPRTLPFLLRADLRILPSDAAVSHVTGLRLYGLDFVPSYPRHWSTNSPGQRRSPDLVLHRRQGLLHPRALHDLPVLGPDRCLVDAATSLSQRDLVRAGDALIRAGLTSRERFEEYAWSVHLDGVTRSRLHAPAMRDRVDSVRETDVRLMVAAAGLPMPEVNAEIRDPQGNFLARGDLVYRRWRIIVEYDGWYHERSAEQRRNDILRRERLEAAGWAVIVLTAADLRQPAGLIGRIWRVFVTRGYTGPTPTYDPAAFTALVEPQPPRRRAL